MFKSIKIASYIAAIALGMVIMYFYMMENAKIVGVQETNSQGVGYVTVDYMGTNYAYEYKTVFQATEYKPEDLQK